MVFPWQKKDKIAVSVLTPIYNVERYLPECLDSLKAQTLKSIEFICINDGWLARHPQALRRERPALCDYRQAQLGLWRVNELRP